MSRLDDLEALANANWSGQTADFWNAGFDYRRLYRLLAFIIERAKQDIDLSPTGPSLDEQSYPWVFMQHVTNLRPQIAGWRDPDGESVSVALLAPNGAASPAATNLASGTFNPVGDPAYRWMGDLRGITALRIMGRIGGSLAASTAIRIQGHPGGDPAVASGDAGWVTLATTAGSHTLNTLFYTPEFPVPPAARRNNALLRAGLFSGNGTADPTLTCCVLNFYET